MATDLTYGWQPAARCLGLLAVLAPLMAACATAPHHHRGRSAFTSREYGVPVSRRVTSNPNPPHGGGIAMVGKPYQVHGQWYKPQANPVGYKITGVASWYGWDFHGRLTANGEIFSANAITGGSPDLPLPCYARVTNLDNGRSLLVRFNDRGPYVANRVVDLSERAATLLGYANTGTAHVRVQYVSTAPLNGDDTNYLMASLNSGGYGDQGDTRLASVEPRQIEPRAVAYDAAPHPRAASHEMSQVLAAVEGLSYADGSPVTDAGAAADAANALAGAASNVQQTIATGGEDGEAIKLGLGVYTDPAAARDTAMQFALLGAVDEDDVETDSGADATRLTLTHLKPGVERQDVLDLVHKLGLKDVVLY